jgi:hypothetical protein
MYTSSPRASKPGGLFAFEAVQHHLAIAPDFLARGDPKADVIHRTQRADTGHQLGLQLAGVFRQ